MRARLSDAARFIPGQPPRVAGSAPVTRGAGTGPPRGTFRGGGSKGYLVGSTSIRGRVACKTFARLGAAPLRVVIRHPRLARAWARPRGFAADKSVRTRILQFTTCPS